MTDDFERGRAAGFAEGVAAAAQACDEESRLYKESVREQDAAGQHALGTAETRAVLASERCAASVRALAPGDVVVVPRATVERARDALFFANSEDHDLPCDECEDALAALEGGSREVSTWAEVDDWRQRHEPRSRIRTTYVERKEGSPLEPAPGERQLVADGSCVIHVQMSSTPYRYHGKDGRVREWRRDQLAHAARHDAILFVALCSKVNGELPLYDPKDARRVLNRLTANIHRVSCPDCTVLLDGEMESGRLVPNSRGVLVGLPEVRAQEPTYPGRQETLAAMVDCPACPRCGATCGSMEGEGLSFHEIRCMACGSDWVGSPAEQRKARAADKAHRRALAMRWI